MKVGFIGNANNYPFMLARAVRQLGHEVCFVVTAAAGLDRPENRYAEIAAPYPGWVHQVELENPFDWISQEKRRERDRAIELLAACDCVVANQLACSLLPRIRRPAMALLTGVDLLVYCDWATAAKQAAQVVSRTPLRRWVRAQMMRAQFLELIRRQRDGIRRAERVSFFPRGLFQEGDRLLDAIGVTAERRVFLQMTDTDDIARSEPPRNDPLRLFCGTRLNWVRPIPDGWCEMDYKGTDVMVRGIGLFFRRTGIRVDLRLVRKGLHVAETMRLLEEEGIADQVAWSDELDQKSYLEECRKADIVFDQLGNSICGMVTLDAMAMGRPVVANGRINIPGSHWNVDNPLCQAANAEEVCAQLTRLITDGELRRNVGTASRRFVEEHFSTMAAARSCIEFFAGRA